MRNHTIRAAAATTVCGGAGCAAREASGLVRRRAEAGRRLCPGCERRLLAELRAVAGLYEECGRLLGGSDQPREKTSGGPLPGMPFNMAAAEARSAFASTLWTWVGLVVEERRLSAPPRSVDALAEFLTRHADWLGTHDAAGDLSEELARVVRRARRVIDPSEARRVPIGGCVEESCAGALAARVDPRKPQVPAEIICDADPAHRWLGHEWLQLSHRINSRRAKASTSTTGRSVNGRSAGDARQDASPEPPAESPSDTRWVSAADIARLWGIAPGSVYRHASERRWRRSTRAGRTYYHDSDVRRTLDRAGRGATAR
ncbi:hypothetical protein ACIBBB_03105 [Streptomyces sp. NPDC051217]|uniref:hypothetical protein n=1 Tax=Streptomyces sp. NPDC051217 TaxID=3365644 RepID=UPI0037A0857D